MIKRKVEDVVFDIVKPITDRCQFELVEVEFKKEGMDWYLRIYIDKEGGITIDDCQAVSEEVSDILDQIDPIDHAYIFEVSSPGIERPLKTERDYKKNLNKEVEVKLFTPQNGKKVFSGTLIGFTEESVTLEQDKQTKIELDKKAIALIKPLIKF